MQSLYSNLISYWPLHEASGNRADLIGSNNALTPTNTPGGGAGIIENATAFVTASSQKLDVASNANLQTGDIDYTLKFWVNLTAKSATQFLVTRYLNTSGNAEYYAYYDNAADRFSFAVCRPTDSAKIVVANNFGAVTTGVWNMLILWHDAAADTVNIEVNAGETDSLATTGALQGAGVANLTIGSVQAGGSYLGGLMCEVGFWKRVLTRQERTWLYNNGRGRTYPFDRRLSAESQLGRDGRHRRGRIPGMIT